MNESTYRKYGSTKNQRLFLNANAVTTDVLQFVRRLEGDYEVNGSFRVTNNLTVNRQFKLLNTDNSLLSDAEIQTAKGRLYVDASRHLQLAESTNLFSPNAIHFTNHDLYVSNRGQSRVISLLARRSKTSVRDVKEGLLLADDRIQLSSTDSATTANKDLNAYAHSSPTSYESSFSIETQNPYSQLHCLYTGLDFQGRSVLSDAKNANVRLSASVPSADVAALTVESHESASVIGSLKFFVNTRTPELPDRSDNWTSVVMPSSATRHVVPQFTNSVTDTSSFLFGGGPIVAGFNGKATHSSVAASFPSLIARNRLDVISSKSLTFSAVDPSLRLVGAAEEESKLDWVPQLLNPALSTHNTLATASLQVRSSSTNQVELTRAPDFHRVVGDNYTYPSAWTVSADGRKLAVGKTARSSLYEKRNPFGVFDSAGTSSFSRSGARIHLQNHLQPSDANLASVQAYLLPSASSSSFTRNYFYGRHLALLCAYPVSNGTKYMNVNVFKHSFSIRYTTNISTGTYAWISRDDLVVDSLELESLNRPLSVSLLLPYSSSSTLDGHLDIDADLSNVSARCALVIGHLSSFQSLRFFSTLSNLDSYKLMDIAGGMPGSLFTARNDLHLCSMNMQIGSTAYFRTITFATSGAVGYAAVQVFDFKDGKQQLATDGFNAQSSMVPMTSDNAHRVMTFPMRAVPILEKDAKGDLFCCSFFDVPTSDKLSFRMLQYVYTYNAAAVAPAKKWSVSLLKVAESLRSVEVPASVLQRVAARFNVNVDTQPAFRTPLYTPFSTLSSGTSVVEAGGAITYTYFESSLRTLVVCIDSAWSAMVQFGDLATWKPNVVASSSLLASSSADSLRSVVLQPVKVWRDVRGRSSVLFLNLAALHANTRALDAQGSATAATYAEIEDRISKLLNDQLPVMVRWDVDELGDTTNVRQLYLRSDVDIDGEWARMLEVTLVSVRKQNSAALYSADPALTSFRSPCFGTIGLLFPDGGANATRDDMEVKRNGSWIQARGDLCVELFQAGQLSLDLEVFNPLLETGSSSASPPQPGRGVSCAVQIEGGDVVLKGDSRIIGENAASGKMVIAPKDPNVPMVLGSRGEVTLDGAASRKRVLVNSDYVVHASRIRGPTLDQMQRQRRLESNRGYEYETLVSPDTYTDERLTIGGDAQRPLRLFLCPDNTGTISTGDITMRNAKVNGKMSLLDTLESKSEAVMNNVRGTAAADGKSSLLRIQGKEDLSSPLTLQLGKSTGDLTDVGSMVASSITTPSLTVQQSLVSQSEASFPYLRGASTDATNVKAELRIEGTPAKPLELFLCQNEGDRVIMGTVISSANSASVMAVQEMYVQNSGTYVNKSKAVFASDLTCTGDEIVLGSSAHATSSIAMNATTTTFLNATPSVHGAQIQDGLLCQW